MQKKTLYEFAVGGGILFLGLIIGRFFSFLYKIVLARSFGPEKYGILSLALTVFGVLTVLSLAGLSAAMKRYVNIFRAKKDDESVRGILRSSLAISFLVSAVLGIMMFLLAGWFSSIFNEPSLTSLLRIFAIALPFTVMLKMIYDFFLAFHKAKFMALFELFFERILLLVLVAIIFWLGQGLGGIAAMYIVVAVLGFFSTIIFFQKRVFPVFGSGTSAYHTKKLVGFALPLLFAGILNLILNWSDNFFLGLLMAAEDVGVYNVAFPVAVALTLFYNSLSLVFYPKIVEFFSKGNKKAIAETFIIVNDWIFLFTFPLFLIFFMVPGEFITLVFGPEYIRAAPVLALLSAAFFFNSITGMVSQILQTYKRTTFIFFVNAIAVVLNIILNLTLIPAQGIIGAAIATGLSIVLRDTLFWFKARSLVKFRINHVRILKITGIGFLSLAITYGTQHALHLKGVTLLLLLFLYVGSYLMLLLYSRSFTTEDATVLDTLLKKIGLTLPEKVKKKFIKKV